VIGSAILATSMSALCGVLTFIFLNKLNPENN
jgi:hypothetical protein